MANKQLTAKVRLNTTQAEKSIDNLVKKINKLNNAVNKANTSNNKVNSNLQKTNNMTSKIAQNLKKWSTNMNTALSKLRPAKSMFDGIWQVVRRIAGALIGIGTIRLAIQGADTLTGVENRLNNVAAKQLGNSAYTTDSSGNVTGYSSAATQFTQDAMDKIYVAAKNSRASYSDMMATISKNMTLAGDAFDNNIDNAIRFQEIMSKAYTVGGASAAEMSTSMYQLTQALGSGVLQGDELRSVREGAPLAFKAIEEFAQGVYNTEESLKDLASQGKITSDMVVAAVMNMGEEIDQAFALTKWRFSEVWTTLMSAGQRAFQPVVSMLTDYLNNAVDSGLIEKAEQFFVKVAKAVMIVMKLIEKGLTWIYDNWDKIKNFIVGGLIAIITYMTVLKVVSIGVAIVQAATWAATHAAAFKVMLILIIIIAVIAAIIYMFYLWASGAITTTDLILNCLMIIAAGAIALGIILGNIPMILIGVIVLFVAWIIKTSTNLCEAIITIAEIVAWAIIAVLGVILVASLAVGTMLISIPMLIALVIIGLLAALLAVFLQWAGEIVGTAYGVGHYLGAVFDNIGIFFNNMIASMKSGWYSFIADLCDDFDWLLKAINSVASFFGKETITVEGLRAKSSAEAAKIQEYVDANAAYTAGYNKGYVIGEDIKANINSWGDKINAWGNSKKDELNKKLGLNGTSALDRLYKKTDGSYGVLDDNFLNNLGDQLGLGDTFGNMGDFPTIGTNPSSVEDLLKDISGDTGSISDSLSLTEEDLEYLRRIADMEWKKEYTTAEIKVEMNNNNQINGDGDLDGIVTRLADKLYEEMNVVANGVYAY